MSKTNSNVFAGRKVAYIIATIRLVTQTQL